MTYEPSSHGGLMNSASLLKAGIHDFLGATAATTTSERRGAGLAAAAALASARLAPRNDGVLSTAAGAVAEVDASAMAGGFGVVSFSGH